MWVFLVPPSAGFERRKRAEVSSRLCGYLKRTSPGVRLRKTVLGFNGWISPEIIFKSGEPTGVLRGVSHCLGRMGAGGSVGRVPMAVLDMSTGGAWPLGEWWRIVSFQSENLQALGNDIQKSI